MDKPTPPTLYAQFDGDTIDGTTYRLGDPIDSKVDAGTLAYLKEVGRIGSHRPATTVVIPADDEKPVDEMGRVELEQTAMLAFMSQLPGMSDDQLRDGVGRWRDFKAQRAADDRDNAQAAADERDAMTGGQPATYQDLKDKPLAAMKTADLTTVAQGEDVDISGATTNAERVKLIEAKRTAQS